MELKTMSRNWQNKKLVDFVKLQRGYDLPEHDRKPGEVPVIGSFGITGYHDVAKVKGPGVTVGRSGVSIGIVCYVPDDYWPLNTALYVTDFYGNDERFAYYFLQTLNLTNHNSGSAQPSLNRNYIYPMPIKIPLLPEQSAIATALSDVDTLISSLDKLIAKKRDIKQATIQQLLTGKTRLPGFSGVWDVKKLSDVFNVTAGGDIDLSRSSSIQDEVHCFPIYSNALSNNGLYGFCSYSDHQAGSITVTARGTLGIANFRNHNFTAIGRVLVLQPNMTIDGRFFSEFINNQIDFVVESTGVPQLTAPHIAKYKLPVPPLSEQQAIATVLSDMDAEISALEQKRDKTRALKQGMMQELLTGKTRLL